MAIKLVDTTTLDSGLTSIANAIRTKSGGSGSLTFPTGFVSEIGNIAGSSGGSSLVSLSEFTAVSSVSNMADALNLLFPDRETYSRYFCFLYGKQEANYAPNQLICFFVYVGSSTTSMAGGGVRYRNNSYVGLGNVASNYDATIEIGDTYLIGEVLSS